MIITEENVNASQIDELSARLFKKKGVVNLDKNDLSAVMAGDQCKLISALQEGETPQSFLHQLMNHLVDRSDVDHWRRMLLYFGLPQDGSLKMADMSIIQETLANVESDFDLIWGFYHNPTNVGLSAVAVYSS